MKFLTDGMLGRFSRWLRLLGYDVKHYNDTSDDVLLRVAGEDCRILLTRDIELLRRANAVGLNAFFLAGKNEVERLANVAQRFNIKLKIDMTISRCSICNSLLRKVDRSVVLDKVPSGTLKYYKHFWICKGCEKIYWQGSHWKKINETLDKAKALMDEMTFNTEGKKLGL